MSNQNKIVRNAWRVTIVVSVFLLTASCGLLPDVGTTFTGKVEYNENGSAEVHPTFMFGSVPVDTRSYKKGDIVTVLGNTGHLVTWDHHVAGWNTQADGSGIEYQAGQTFEMTSDTITLYAIWQSGTRQWVTYDSSSADSGNVPLDGNEYADGETITVPGNTGNLVKTGYMFVGWSRTPSADFYFDDYYLPGDTFNVTTDNLVSIALFAVWGTGPFPLTYDPASATSGTVPTDDKLYYSVDKAIVKGNSGNLEKAGYTFTGWYPYADQQNGNTYHNSDNIDVHYTEGELYSPLNGTTLYAQWSPYYTLTYDANGATGGSVPTDSTKHLSNSYVNVKTNSGKLTKPGYIVWGWNREPDATGHSIDFNGYYYDNDDHFDYQANSSRNVTLYPIWRPATILTLNADYIVGNLSQVAGTVYFAIDVSPGTYKIAWDDAGQGSGTYTLNANVFAYHENSLEYFFNHDSGYNVPQTIIVPSGESSVVIMVKNFTDHTGTFGIRVFQ